MTDLTFLLILSLKLYFVSEIWWDTETCEGSGLEVLVQTSVVPQLARMATGSPAPLSIHYCPVPSAGTLNIGMVTSRSDTVVRDREAWRAAVHGVAKSQTRLGD